MLHLRLSLQDHVGHQTQERTIASDAGYGSYWRVTGDVGSGSRHQHGQSIEHAVINHSPQSFGPRLTTQHLGAQRLVDRRGRGGYAVGCDYRFFFRAKAPSMLRGWTEIPS